MKGNLIMNEQTKNIVSHVNSLIAKRALIEARKKDAEFRVNIARKLQGDIDVVQSTIQYVAARVQSDFGNFISTLVTKAIHHVFPHKRKDNFIVTFRENRGKTECELNIVTEKGAAAHPFHCSGGGVWDVSAFALLCSCLVLEQPAKSRFLFLDEPFKNLHGWQKRKRAIEMLGNTCKTLGIGAIIVHQADDGEDEKSGLDSLLSDPRNKVYLVEQPEYERSIVKQIV